MIHFKASSCETVSPFFSSSFPPLVSEANVKKVSPAFSKAAVGDTPKINLNKRSLPVETGRAGGWVDPVVVNLNIKNFNYGF